MEVYLTGLAWVRCLFLGQERVDIHTEGSGKLCPLEEV